MFLRFPLAHISMVLINSRVVALHQIMVVFSNNCFNNLSNQRILLKMHIFTAYISKRMKEQSGTYNVKQYD